ncbi:MAG TPA: ABC transporter ATP-binding protein [Caulobacteraceae bacterium]
MLTGAFIAFARWRAAGGAALIALGTVFDGLGLLLLVPVLGLVVGPGAGGAGGRLTGAAESLLGPWPAPWRLPVVLLAFAGLMLVRSAVLRQRDRVTETLQLEFVEHVRMTLVRKLAGAGWPAVAGARHARVLQALSVEIHEVGIATHAALLAAVALVMLVGHCILALALAPLAGALAIAFVVAAGLVSRPYLDRSKRLGRTIVEAHVGMAESAATFLDGLKLALAQGLEARFVDGYASAATDQVRDRVQFQDLKSRLRNLTSGVAALTGALALLAGVEVFHLPPAVLITLLLVLSRMGALASAVQQGAQQVAHSLPAYGAILAVEAELVPQAEASRLAPPAPRRAGRDEALAFVHVDYAHDPDSGRTPEFAHTSLTIPAGAFVGIVGPSGVGKTTFLDLAAGVLRPQAGAVWAFGQALEGEALPGHREGLAYVAQDPFLFDGAVRANLAWAAPGRSDAEMLQALETVGAQRLLRRLERGLDTRIGHRGALLSAGERQRLALACAILRRPRLYLLDEATNAIDVESEAAILHGLAALCPEATILMVAHRAESLRLCDAILEFPGPVFGPVTRTERQAV